MVEARKVLRSVLLPVAVLLNNRRRRQPVK